MSATTFDPVRDLPAQRSPQPAHDATLQHCVLIRQKIDNLTSLLTESAEQMYLTVEREYQAGRYDLDDLAVIYEQARAMGPGFATLWNKHMSVKRVAVQDRLRRRAIVTPNGPGGHFWSGPYPYDLDAPRPLDGIPVVYVLYSSANEPIYVGSSGSFCTRLTKHHQDKVFTWWMAYPCGSREAAYLLEDGLLAARKMTLNKRAGR